MPGLPSRAPWPYKCPAQCEREPPGHTIHFALTVFLLLIQLFFLWSYCSLCWNLRKTKIMGTCCSWKQPCCLCLVAIEPDSCTKARPIRVHFNRSVFSVWKKNANRTSQPRWLLCISLFAGFCRNNIFSSDSHVESHAHTHRHIDGWTSN